MNAIKLNYDTSRQDTFTADLPSSKSMAARAIIIAALAGVSPEKIGNLPDCTDTRELSSAVNSLLGAVPSPALRIESERAGETPLPVRLDLNLGLGGTSLRFFTALAASIPGLSILEDCAAPLKKRPLAPLCNALSDAGADIEFLGEAGYPPMMIRGEVLKGGSLKIDGAISSQFISAIIMTAPYWRLPLRLTLTGDHPVSLPYIEMTAEMMRRAGASVTLSEREIDVSTDKYSAETITAPIPSRPGSTILSPEADWSAASYFYELALLLPDREIKLARLTPPRESLQGDSGCAAIFNLFGVDTIYHPDGSATLRCDKSTRDSMAKISATTPVELDMSETPDLVPAIAVALCMAGIRFEITGVAHLRHKESDRLEALSAELAKIGFAVTAGVDTLCWNGDHSPADNDALIETYGDHRIAMAFGIAAANLPALKISNPKVTEKSFPGFFSLLEKAGFSAENC